MTVNITLETGTLNKILSSDLKTGIDLEAPTYMTLSDLPGPILERFEELPFDQDLCLHTEDFDEIESWDFYKGVLEMSCTLNQYIQITEGKFHFTHTNDMRSISRAPRNVTPSNRR